jgi:DNA-binding NarL/FixJ family response regulator
VLTTSQNPADVLDSYSLHANAYVTKPLSLEDLTCAVTRIDEFFAMVVTLPVLLPEAS